MANLNTIKPYPIRHYIRMMFVISFVVLILDLVISIASISMVKQQSTQYLQDAADLYINRINHDFAYINHFMGWTLANDENLDNMNTYGVNSIPFLKANEKLHLLFAELQRNYGQSYNFFYYLENSEYFLNCAPISISYSDYSEVKKQIITLTRDKGVYEKFYSHWTPIHVNGTSYLINIVPYYNRYLIALISADELIAPLQQINLGANGYASLVDENGVQLSGPAGGDHIPEVRHSFLDLFQSHNIVSSDFSNAAFSVRMAIKFGAFEKIMVAQLLIMLLFLIVTSTLSAIIMFFRRNLLVPIQRFSKNLARINEGDEATDFKSSRIMELEQVNAQFKELVAQIKRFKIDRYEQELEKQKIRLDYMKLQIKPHFFLNCLTSMYSMAQMQMYEEIESMALATSRYFRYIFQSGENFVLLKDEIEHVRTFLDIQKSRYRDAFSYRIEHPDVITGIAVPPLVIQTFIENAVKYGVSRDRELCITLSVTEQRQENGDHVLIRISDTGPGFSPDVLDALMRGEALEQTGGNRIGIMNTIQRLELLYRDEANITFANDASGARITLSLPKMILNSDTSGEVTNHECIAG
ncbi:MULTISPECIES: sensor histidine kinase [unclassified Paenibacillus]|uniref:sensor histidine kinase n=1 Tax=unclassified Paenibacillus TaxID=185978 RepID=UPI00091E76C9|nr:MULTISPECIES: histidine kinase [unclassified Paenibacillus]SHN56142.1 Sensor histidine kinase YesM [Paenibacillus sp. ov031]SLJ95053.1 Sensor histidine kinase YesM [Paenibacillus sp. RU5A]SOC67413.1 Sensor histidine kinase YesM [Paenibacillus sp. RU26A]SOC69114.1 Sensor histidine kinase YesM [Paenibacillus sp. RU5M]